MIARKYPGTSFQIGPGVDDERATHITAVVDLHDPDQVMDLVIDRLVTIQVDESLPISVIPIRTAERAAEIEQELRDRLVPPTLPPAAIS